MTVTAQNIDLLSICLVDSWFNQAAELHPCGNNVCRAQSFPNRLRPAAIAESNFKTPIGLSVSQRYTNLRPLETVWVVQCPEFLTE